MLNRATLFLRLLLLAILAPLAVLVCTLWKTHRFFKPAYFRTAAQRDRAHATMIQKPRNVLITGATSGIGRAMAEYYAQNGARSIAICGRNQERLDATAAVLAASGVRVHAGIVDVTDKDATRRWIAKVDAEMEGGIELAIANAGVASELNRFVTPEQWTAADSAVWDINVGGLLNCAYPCIEAFRRRGRGQLAIMSSLASYAPVSFDAYSATKIAVRTWGERMRIELAPLGVSVNVLCPGFIKTPMTDVLKVRLPFLMDLEPATKLMVEALARDEPVASFPLPLWLVTTVIGALPTECQLYLMTSMFGAGRMRPPATAATDAVVTPKSE